MLEKERETRRCEEGTKEKELWFEWRREGTKEEELWYEWRRERMKDGTTLTMESVIWEEEEGREAP